MISPDNGEEPRATPGPLCDSLVAMLTRRLTAGFGIPPGEAAAMVREARLALLMNVAPVPDPETWLVGLVSEMGRAYWQRGLPPDATAEEARAIAELAFTSAAVATLSPRLREALRLRFHEKKTFREIAAELDVAEPYALRMVTRGVTKVLHAQRRR